MIKLWFQSTEGSSQKCECTFTMKAHEKAVTAGCWLMPGPMVVTGSEDSTIVLWEVVKRANTYR